MSDSALLRRVSRRLLPEVPWALLVCVAVVAAGGGGALSWAGGLGLAAAVGLRSVPGVLAGGPQPGAAGLPGFTAPRPLPGTRTVGAAVAGVSLLGVLAGLVGHPWLTLVLALLLLLVEAGLVLLARQRRRHRPQLLRRLNAALAAAGPECVIYTARKEGGSYQVRMWAEQLDRMGVRYAVVVRHRGAVEPVRRVCSAPIVCLPGNADLDFVAVPGMKVAFYVNMVAQNTAFVLHRELTHVYLGHGDSDKELSTHPGHGMFDRIFIAGPAALDRYRAHRVLIAPEKFTEVGRPQLAGVEQVRPGTAPGEGRTVLLAPTWRGYNAKTSLSALSVCPLIAEALVARGVTVIFRAHPFSRNGRQESAVLRRVDAVLAADRSRTGRRHELSGETRGADLIDAINRSDACIADVGSVLVDYLASYKPYAAILPPHADPADFPTTVAAHRRTLDQLEGAEARAEVDRLLEELLVTDQLAAQRVEQAHRCLGSSPGDPGPFQDAVRDLLGSDRSN